MSIALYPGTFDPITLGHIDLAQRASKMFTEVIAVVSENKSKNTMFTADERLYLAQESLKEYPNIKVIKYGGLIVDAVKEYQASTIVRGLRAISDFDYEFQMAFTNRQLDSDVDTVFLMPSEKYTYLSSSMVRQIASFHGDFSQFVTPIVAEVLKQKLALGND